jgi:hypothetical protein
MLWQIDQFIGTLHKNFVLLGDIIWLLETVETIVSILILCKKWAIQFNPIYFSELVDQTNIIFLI